MLKPFQKARSRLSGLLVCSFLLTGLLAVCWVFRGRFWDGWLPPVPAGGHWPLVITLMVFSALSLLLPGVLLYRQLDELQAYYRAMLTARAQTDTLARHDSLTGLLSRRVFMEQLSGWLSTAGIEVTVGLLDLDLFRQVNDGHGHAVGDSVLCEQALRLEQGISGNDVLVARVGGDEFAFAIRGHRSREQLYELATRLLASMARPLQSLDGQLVVTATLGLAMAPLDGREASLLLQRADSAMRRGKNASRSVFYFYEHSFDEQKQALARFEAEVRLAVVEGQIVPFYQPVVRLPERQVTGFEILARWIHPVRGLQSPATFIPVVERLGLMESMTRLLLCQACHDALAGFDGNIGLSVNITTAMIEDPGFPDYLGQLLDSLGFPCHRLEVEVTEDALIHNFEVARQNLLALQGRGIRVALDDFGTGYSGLYHLTRLAIDKIKIDQSFFRDISLENQDQMVGAILGLGRHLNIQVTAEGVEQARQYEWLVRHGCDFAQGYLFGRPMPAAEAIRFLRQSQGAMRPALQVLPE